MRTRGACSMIAAAFLSAASFSPSLAQTTTEFAIGDRWAPPDEGIADKGLVALRQRLFQAASACEVDRILAMFDGEVLTSESPYASETRSGPRGLRQLTEEWHLSGPEAARRATEFCEALRQAVTLPAVRETGGGAAPDRYCAPAVVCEFNRIRDEDRYDTVVLVADKVSVYRSPSTRAAIIETLSHQLVRLCTGAFPCDGMTDAPGWWSVKMPDGRVGYVRWNDGRYWMSHYIVFEKRGREWRVVEFRTRRD